MEQAKVAPEYSIQRDNNYSFPERNSKPSINGVSSKISVGTRKPSVEIDLASYFRPWINFGYYFMLMPFKLVWEENSYKIRTNRFQKTLCGILHASQLVNSLFDFRFGFVTKIRVNPELFMIIFNIVIYFSYIVIFLYTVWFKKNTVLAICKESKLKNCAKLVTWKISFACGVFVLLYSVLDWMFQHFDVVQADFRFEYYVREIRWQFFFTKYSNQTIGIERSISTVATAVVLFFRLREIMIETYATFASVLAGIVSYIISKQFKELMSETRNYNPQDVTEAYMKITNWFKKLNDFVGLSTVPLFLLTTTLCARRVVAALDTDAWHTRISLCVIMAALILAFVSSAEAHYQSSYFKTWLLLSSKRAMTEQASLEYLRQYFLEVEECNLAIKGGRFFTVTYRFLGTAASVVLTYAIIQLQLRGAAPKPCVLSPKLVEFTTISNV